MPTLPLRSFVFGLFLALAAFAVLAGTPAEARDYRLGTLTIGHPWARPSTGKTGAAYFTIANSGPAEDALIGVESAAAAKSELHEMTMDGAIMRMRAVPRLAVAAGKSVAVAPGGLHVMLIGLKAPLRDGEAFPMTLVFEKAGRIAVSVQVQASAGMPAGQAKPGAGMPGLSGGMGDMPGMNGMH